MPTSLAMKYYWQNNLVSDENLSIDYDEVLSELYNLSEVMSRVFEKKLFYIQKYLKFYVKFNEFLKKIKLK